MKMLYIILLQATNTPQSMDVDYKLIMTIVSALSGAIIGGIITIWYKRSEIKGLSQTLKFQSDNLDLQKQLFQETLANNELKIKAELVRLEDLNRQYKLSLQKFDFEHLSKILAFADGKDDKAQMMREFSNKLHEYNSDIPFNFIDFYDYQEYVVDYIYYRLDDIAKEITSLLAKYPDVFSSIHKDFQLVASSAKNIKSQIIEYKVHSDEIDDEELIQKFFEDLYSLHEKYNNLLEIMQEEFKELETIRRNYIKNQFAKRTQE
jgi:hypothetical protein